MRKVEIIVNDLHSIFTASHGKASRSLYLESKDNNRMKSTEKHFENIFVYGIVQFGPKTGLAPVFST